MKIINSLMAASAVFFSNTALSELVIPTGVGCDTVSGECFIILKAPFVSKVCEGGSNTQLRLDPTKAGSTGQYSAALAAYMGGKRLQVGSTSCFKNEVEPSYLYVTD